MKKVTSLTKRKLVINPYAREVNWMEKNLLSPGQTIESYIEDLVNSHVCIKPLKDNHKRPVVPKEMRSV